MARIPPVGVVHHMRILHPADGIVAFYDGRVEGYRFAEDLNWVDDGALALGIASYAIVDGDEALIYDTHVSVEHARFVREALEAEGVERFVVVLSHKHLDHIAGTEVFADCEVIATARTAEALAAHRGAIEAGTQAGPPAIDPLVLPTRTFEDRMTLEIGRLSLELIHVDIHSDDAAVIWLAHQRVLFAGDTLEDTVTYVDKPDGLDRHLADLERLWELGPERILPNHGDPDIIAGGGYPIGFIRATQDYIRFLQRCRREPQLRDTALTEVVADAVAAGWTTYYAPYEEVHRENLAAVSATTTPDPHRMRDLPIRGDSIRLGQALKLSGVAESGGEARALIEEGAVTVNAEPETRRGRQLRHGDVVAVGDDVLRIDASAAQR